jgi:hypothetical protein
MDVLNVNGKSFVKASVLARELGYTADYIGQLCRGKKVSAQLVGRSWYVDRDSIREHKKNRYRSTHAQSIKAIQLEKNNTVAKSGIQNSAIDSNFYRYSATAKPVPKYEPDDADLLPHIKAPLSDSLNVKVKSAETSQLETEQETQIHTLHPKEVEHLNVEKRPINKVISSNSSITVAGSSVEDDANPSGNIVRPRQREKEVEHTKHTKAVMNRYSSLFFALAVTVAVCIFVILVGFESQVFVSGQTLVSKYIFNMHTFTIYIFSLF